MTRFAAIPLLALGLAANVPAHRLDEYLQATLIGVARGSVDLEIQLTPGVAVLPVVMSEVDRDRDGRISSEEARVYAARVVREVELRVDGRPASLSLVESTFPTLEEMRQGLGTIRLKLRASRVEGYSAVHDLRFINRHLPQVSVYLVNCLAAPGDGLTVGRQQRDEAQRSISFGYSFGKSAETAQAWFTREPFWLAMLGTVLLVRIATLASLGKQFVRIWGSLD
jgi:hypothetical protein